MRGAVGLGHRRLSVIDLSDAGLQPMWHSALPVCIVYNGEVYNYLELRAELAHLGHRFNTRTDTEVILAAYLEWGRACVERFNGMWSLAILDERNASLFCSRDRFGVKPFYWIDTPTLFAFGSEIRQLLPLCSRRAAHAERVRDYLVSGLSDHTDDSFHAGVHQLAPGYSLNYDLVSHRHRVERHYTLSAALPQGADAAATATNAAEVASRLRALLDDAVRVRMRSDVRLGTCLSGGLDSSAIAMIASRLHGDTGDPFRAITAVSELRENSEETYAARVVAAYHLKWVKVLPKTDDFIGAMATLMQTQEEPFGGPSVAMQYFVMQAARAEGVTVLLDGQGADESLFGYDRHVVPLLRERLRAAGFAGLHQAAKALVAHNDNVSWCKLGGMLAGSYFPALIAMAMVPRLNGARFKPALPLAWQSYLQRLDDAAQVQISDIQATSLPMLLRFEDRNSMRHAIEARLPFLDYRLIEWALATRVDFKIRAGWTKWPLRKAVDADLPAEVVWRKRKLGFEAPDRLWLEACRPAMKAAVAGSRLLTEFFDLRKLTASYDRLDRGVAWRSYCLAAWEQQSGITEIA